MAVNPEALRVALETSLVENPDDLATYSAYGDLLMEQGDPRGEFLQVQLALEDEYLPIEERRSLQAREKELLAQHERAWLGPLASYLLDQDTGDLNQNYYVEEQRFEYRWQRGFLDSVQVHHLTRRFAHALADSSVALLLRELKVGNDHGYWNEAELNPPPRRVHLATSSAQEQLNLMELLEAPCLSNLRRFQMGEETGGELGWTDCHNYSLGLETVLARMSRIEELVLLTKGYDIGKVFRLSNLTNLRILQVEHLEDYPLEALATNPAMTNLTHLWLHPHFFGDLDSEKPESEQGYLPLSKLRALVQSPYLKRLTHLRFRMSTAGNEGVKLLLDSGFLGQLRLLDLRHGCIRDEAARLLAEYPDLKNLELLDLSRNQLTSAGVRLLQATGVNVRCDDQHAPGGSEYLCEGDFE